MKTHHILFALGIVLGISFSPLFASGKSALPRPLVSLNETGSDYFITLTKMDQMLLKGEVLEFYREFKKIRKKIDANKEIRRLEGRDESSKEDLAACEWLLYLGTQTPIISSISDEEYKNKKFSREAISEFEDSIGLDLDCKRWICFALKNADTVRIAKLFSRDRKQIDENHIRYWQAIYKMYFDTEKLLNNEVWKGEDFFKKEVVPIREDEDLPYNQKIRNFRLYLSLKRNKSEGCRDEIADTKEAFVRKLIKTYPRDARRIQDILMKSGFSTKEQCRDLLLETVGKNKSTEYLFEGLPKLGRKTNLKK